MASAAASSAAGGGGSSSSLTTGLARKLKKVLEIRTDSPELLLSLSALSSFYSDNTPQARKNLRATIERRGLSINQEFLDASEDAQQVSFAVRGGCYPRAHGSPTRLAWEQRAAV